MKRLRHCSALSVALAATAATAQLPSGTFTDAIDVRVVNLEVVVTDRDGEHVTGLMPDDFDVRIDGESVPIEFFSEIYEEPPALDAEESLERERSPALADAPPVNYLVFIDDLMTLERNRDFVLVRLREELDALRPRDRMAVVRYAGTHSGRRLEILSEWTRDRDQLRAAFDAAMEADAYGIKYIALRRMENYIANWEGNDTRRSILAAAASLRALPAPEGRNALILIAGSWDPVEAVRADYFSEWCVAGRCRGYGIYNVLADTANYLGYSIYAVDVEGRDPDSWRREQRLQFVLGALANATGGKRLLNAERQRVLAIASADKRSYYSIGVVPAKRDDEIRQRVEVRARRRGLHVRTQRTIVQVSREWDQKLDVLNALLSGRRTDVHGFRLEVADPIREPNRMMRIPFDVVIPVEQLQWLDDTAHIEIQVAHVDARGNSSDVAVRSVKMIADIELPDDVAVRFPLETQVRRRQHTLAVFVRDLQGDTVLSDVVDVAPSDRHDPDS